MFGELFVSQKSKGNHSSAVCATWAGAGGNLTTDNAILRVGLVQYFIRHTIRLPVSASERVSWFKTHPRENWFHHHALVVSKDMSDSGPSGFLPVSRIRSRCALIEKDVKFDYGEDSVNVVIFCGSNYFV